MRGAAKFAGLFFGIAFLAASGAAGQAAKKAKPDCQDAKTQMEMNECSAAAYQDADKELNTLYASLLKKLEPGNSTKLRNAQRAWLTYRDANCAAETALYQGGSIQPSVHSGCLERVTRTRIAELHTVYDTGTR